MRRVIFSKSFPLSIALAVILTACGGGGGGAAGGNSILKGKVVDGYISGATVCLDLNKNGVCDAGEPSGKSGVGGSYTLEYPSSAVLAGVPVIVDVPVGAVDESDGVIAKPLFLSTPADSAEIISPFSTLAVFHMKFNPGLTYKQSMDAITQKLLGSDVVIDPAKDFVANDPQIQGAARALVALMQDTVFDRSTTESNYNSLLSMAPAIASYGYSNPTAAKTDLHQQVATKIASAAKVTTVKVAANAYQASPVAFAVDASGVIYSVDGNRILKTVQNADLAMDATVSVYATGFSSPNSVTVTPNGNVYVADGSQIFKIDTSGNKTVLTGSTAVGSADGALSQATFSGVLAIAAEGDDVIDVADSGNASLRKIDLASGAVTTYDFSAYNVTLVNPSSISADKYGDMTVVDNGKVFTLKTTATSGVARTYIPKTSVVGIGGAVYDSNGNLYFTDTLRARIMIVAFKLTCIACVGEANESIYSGGGTSGNLDGAASVATYRLPGQLVLGADGSLYVADTGNRAIRKIK